MSTTALLALDRLNRAARCRDCPVAPGLIYAFKDAALLRLWGREGVTHRRVAYEVPTCGHCGGSGWHLTERPDRRAEGCWTCGGHGSTAGHGCGPTLRFVETTIARPAAPALVWHSPVTGGGAGIELWNRLWPADVGGVGDWRPRMPGEPLPAHEIARDLLTVEDWIGPMEWAYHRWHLEVPPGSLAAREPAVVEWHRRHPVPPLYVPPAVVVADTDTDTDADIPF